ncbi:MAG: ECF transporter S component [Limnochordaceae bacterium]|nr:ECF transporter S component [Limnochordaceae bacterium]
MQPGAQALTRRVVAAAILLAFVTGFQALGLPQLATGPVVNATLFLAAWTVGPLFGAAIGLLTPVVALWRGILAAPLAPMVPFIAVGNGVLVVIAYYLRRVHLSVAIAVAAVAKFALLATAVRALVSVPAPIAVAMQWPQLYTAILGGLLAWLVWKALPASYRMW